MGRDASLAKCHRIYEQGHYVLFPPFFYPEGYDGSTIDDHTQFLSRTFRKVEDPSRYERSPVIDLDNYFTAILRILNFDDRAERESPVGSGHCIHVVYLTRGGFPAVELLPVVRSHTPRIHLAGAPGAAGRRFPPIGRHRPVLRIRCAAGQESGRNEDQGEYPDTIKLPRYR